jgi:hypothetical protein
MTNWDHGDIAAELLKQAKEEHGNPSHANTLALVGIGNALLQIANELADLEWLRRMTGCLDEIAHTPSNHPRGPWG